MATLTKYRVQVTLSGEKHPPLKRVSQEILAEFAQIASQYADILTATVGTIGRTMIAVVTFRAETMHEADRISAVALERLSPQWNHEYDVCTIFSPVVNSTQ